MITKDLQQKALANDHTDAPYCYRCLDTKDNAAALNKDNDQNSSKLLLQFAECQTELRPQCIESDNL